MQEGPELLDFSVDEVAEQLTLMDAVRTREGRGAGGGQVPLSPDPTHPPPPLTPPPLRNSSCACDPGSAWAPCGHSETVQGPQALPPLCAPL